MTFNLKFYFQPNYLRGKISFQTHFKEGNVNVLHQIKPRNKQKEIHRTQKIGDIIPECDERNLEEDGDCVSNNYDCAPGMESNRCISRQF